MLMNATADHRSFATTPSAEIGSPAAKSAIVARRTRVPDQPRRRKNPGSQPPKTLPRSAADGDELVDQAGVGGGRFVAGGCTLPKY